MVLTNEIRSCLDAGGGAREAAEILVRLLAPMAPHISEELWREDLGGERSVHVSGWPEHDPALAAEERITMVVQVDGKVRDRIAVDVDITEEACRELALASERAQRALGDREVARVIVRAPKLVNIVGAR